MDTLRAELLAEIGPRTHIADLCARALQEINMKAARIAILEQEIKRLRKEPTPLQPHRQTRAKPLRLVSLRH